ncbi:MAG: hypothetical protein IMZ61_11880 [Planctomycetes bacterium]|nr:hypothetical protein [Planctomycetota bacterium]
MLVIFNYSPSPILIFTEWLGVEASGGIVRVRAVHYNTLDEVVQLAEVLKKKV